MTKAERIREELSPLREELNRRARDLDLLEAIVSKLRVITCVDVAPNLFLASRQLNRLRTNHALIKQTCDQLHEDLQQALAKEKAGS